MDKIFSSAFDFFAYALPGTFILISLALFYPTFLSPLDLLQLKPDTTQLAVCATVGYLLGFALNNVGRFIYKKYGKIIWPQYFKFEDLDTHLNISEKYALIRELSPTNFKYIEIWNVFCSMSHNMALSCALLFIISLIKLVFFKISTLYLDWVLVAFVSLLLFFLFLHRAVVFYSWAATDINATIKCLKLREKVGLIENQDANK